MKLAHISFSRPIPIPGTHERISEFSAADGWDIVDDDGRTWLTRAGNPALGRPPVRFYTYVNGSCLPMADVTHFEGGTETIKAEGFTGMQLQGDNGPLDVIADPTHSTIYEGPARLVTKAKKGRKR